LGNRDGVDGDAAGLLGDFAAAGDINFGYCSGGDHTSADGGVIDAVSVGSGVGEPGWADGLGGADAGGVGCGGD